MIRAVQERAALGLSFGAPTRIETKVAQKICEIMPSIELVRMVSSGHRSDHERASAWRAASPVATRS